MKKIMSMKNTELGYHMVKISLGVSIFMHGAVRLPKLQAFSDGMAGQFGEALLGAFIPYPLLFLVALLIPFAEVIAGALILLGGKTVRWGCLIGGLLMGVIMIGAAILENWGSITSALIHLGLFYLLLMNKHTK